MRTHTFVLCVSVRFCLCYLSPCICFFFDLFWIYINFHAKLADKWSIIANLLWFEKEGVTRAIWCIRLWMDSRKRLKMYCFRIFFFISVTPEEYSHSIQLILSSPPNKRKMSHNFFLNYSIQMKQQTLFAKHSK